MWVYRCPSGTRTTLKPPLCAPRFCHCRHDPLRGCRRWQNRMAQRGEIGWDIIYRLRGAIRLSTRQTAFGGLSPIAPLRTPSGGGCAFCGGSTAPEPPRPSGSCVPLRRAVAVLGVTACGMCPARLSREVCLVAVGLARWPVA